MKPSEHINLLQDKKIAIVGGGPGGLTLARLLQLKGAEVKVYERDLSQSSRVQGAIVDLHFDSGLKVLEAAGLLDAFKTSYMPGADSYRLVDPNLNVYLDEKSDGRADDFGNENFRPEIDRGALRKLLIASLLPDTVVWDSHFVGMSKVNETWELEFKNGSKATADLVIGADGYRSGIRSHVTDIKALYSGATIIQGEIDQPERDCPEMYRLVNQANLIAMGIGKTISAQPRGDGGLTFYAASMYPEDWISDSGIDFNNSEEVYAYLLKHYEGWHPVFFSLFKACPRFIPRPLNYFPAGQDWKIRADVTLIGDAAHLMPPNGEGVNAAMLDALELSNCLTGGSFNDLQTAVAAYEQEMFARTNCMVQEALEGIEDFASPSEESIKKLLQLFEQADEN